MGRPAGRKNRAFIDSGLTYHNILLMLVIGVPVRQIAWGLDVPPEVIDAIKVRMREEYKLRNTVFLNSCLIGMNADQQEIAEHLLMSNFNEGDKECV